MIPMGWRDLIEWWAGQRWWIRFGVAGLLLAAGIGAMVAGWFRAGGGAAATGAILLLLSFPNKAERRGYHDF